MRMKWSFVITLMLVCDLSLCTDPDETDWFSAYGARRDEEDGRIQEDELREAGEEGTRNRKKCQQNIYCVVLLVVW